jgi:hypothetical protein
MEAPMSDLPSDRMSLKALRSSESAMARRRSALSNGGTSRLTMRFVLTFMGATSHTASGAWDLMSFRSGIVTSVGKVMSNLPAMKARIAVDRFGMMVNSSPSR